ncbi:MAG TPA: hypothetical protein VKH37_09445, partial [Ferruginibacter sp.]|nr:hypothetical protein [Ferruginibacter sp.]
DAASKPEEYRCDITRKISLQDQHQQNAAANHAIAFDGIIEVNVIQKIHGLKLVILGDCCCAAILKVRR